MKISDLTNIAKTEHDVIGLTVIVWHPTKDDVDFSISLKSGGWLVGLYDSVESALVGAECDLRSIPEFYEMQKRVNYFYNENRLISLEDLNLVSGFDVKELV